VEFELEPVVGDVPKFDELPGPADIARALEANK